MDISKSIILEGKLKFSLIEGRLRMPPTGMQRQCLRLGTCECASIICIYVCIRNFICMHAILMYFVETFTYFYHGSLVLCVHVKVLSKFYWHNFCGKLVISCIKGEVYGLKCFFN